MTKPRLRFQRANYLVADLDRALTFYRDVLGFEVVFVKDSEADSYSYDVFEIDRTAPMRFCVLRTDEQPNVMALTEVTNLPRSDASPRRAGIVLEARDIEDTVEAAKAMGLTVYREDHLVTKDGREGVEYGLVDFDGNLVVLYLIQQEAP
jgi:catechol 2,3-dioxygenase-like lactoylglutathione lyase family enzyme